MKNLWAIILITLLIALSTSVVTSVYTNRYLDNYLASLNVDVPLEDRFVQGPRALPGTYEESLERIDDVREVSLAGLVGAYNEAAGVNQLIYREDIFQVVAITSDGWFLHPTTLVSPQGGYSVIKDGKSYEVTDFVNISGATLVKVEGLSLEPVAFAKTRDFVSGNQFLEVGQDYVKLNALVRAGLLDNRGQAFSDEESVYWEVRDEISDPTLIFDTTGQFVGVSNIQNTVKPIHTMIADIQSALSGGEESTLTFGLTGVFLTDAINHPEGWPTVGYYVSSARAETSFEAGDVILSVDGALIAEPDDFTDLLASYELGEEVSVRVWRDGETLELISTVLN